MGTACDLANYPLALVPILRYLDNMGIDHTKVIVAIPQYCYFGKVSESSDEESLRYPIVGSPAGSATDTGIPGLLSYGVAAKLLAEGSWNTTYDEYGQSFYATIGNVIIACDVR